MSDLWRQCPRDKLIIERSLDGSTWYWYRVCDSPNDARRSLSVLRGEQDEQPSLLIPEAN